MPVLLASIPSPPSNGFHIGPLEVHAYGLAYVLALIAAIAVTVRRWERLGGSRQLVYDVALWGFPAGLVGGRLYFLATSWNEVPSQWWGPLAVWKGGLGIWGGIAGGTLAGVWVLHRRRADVGSFLDAAAPGLLVAQAIGRIGNYFNQELFGGPTTLPWGLSIDSAHRPARYAAYATFHPTFLYELVWNFALAAALVWLGRHRRIRAPGLFALYVAGYSAFRVFEELLRTDPAHHILGLRLNFFVASLLCLSGLTWFASRQRTDPSRHRRRKRGPAGLGLVFAIAVLSGCGHATPTATAGTSPPATPSALMARGSARTAAKGVRRWITCSTCSLRRTGASTPAPPGVPPASKRAPSIRRLDRTTTTAIAACCRPGGVEG